MDISDFLAENEKVLWSSDPKDRELEPEIQNRRKLKNIGWLLLAVPALGAVVAVGIIFELNAYLTAMDVIASIVLLFTVLVLFQNLSNHDEDELTDNNQHYFVTNSRLLLVHERTRSQTTIFPEAILEVSVRRSHNKHRVMIKTGFEEDQYLSLFNLVDAEELATQLTKLKSDTKGHKK